MNSPNVTINMHPPATGCRFSEQVIQAAMKAITGKADNHVSEEHADLCLTLANISLTCSQV